MEFLESKFYLIIWIREEGELVDNIQKLDFKEIMDYDEGSLRGDLKHAIKIHRNVVK